MDTGNYMANQMSDLIEHGEQLKEDFDNWLYTAIEEWCKGKRRDPHDVYPQIDLTDAKLSFMNGVLAQDYLKDKWL